MLSLLQCVDTTDWTAERYAAHTSPIHVCKAGENIVGGALGDSQSCIPRDSSLGLETARDRNSAVLVLVLALEVLVLVLKHWSRLFSRAINNWNKIRVPTTLQNSFSLTFTDKMNNFPWLISLFATLVKQY